MKVGCPAALGMTLVLAFAAPASSAYFDHSPYDGILRHYVDEDGTVDYDGIRLNSLTALESYFETLANADLAGWPRPEQTAFWINAYNARVLYRVAQKPRLKKMSQAWGLLELPSKVAGRMISPVDIKHLLRKSGDPRILFALSDGTLGGPKLCNAAYTADTLDMMLEKEASTFVNSQNVQEIRGHLQLSNVFKWYEKDFQKTGGVPAFITSRLNPDQRSDGERIKMLLATAYRKCVFVYNWTFNDRKNKAMSPQSQMLTPGEVPPDAFSMSNPDLSKDR